jgi:hypothetical protein
MANQTSRAILNAVGDVEERLTWLDASLCPLTDLTMCLSCLTIVREEFAIEVVKVPFLLVGGSVPIFVLVFDFFALGKGVVWE